MRESMPAGRSGPNVRRVIFCQTSVSIVGGEAKNRLKDSIGVRLAMVGVSTVQNAVWAGRRIIAALTMIIALLKQFSSRGALGRAFGVSQVRAASCRSRASARSCEQPAFCDVKVCSIRVLERCYPALCAASSQTMRSYKISICARTITVGATCSVLGEKAGFEWIQTFPSLCRSSPHLSPSSRRLGYLLTNTDSELFLFNGRGACAPDLLMLDTPTENRNESIWLSTIQEDLDLLAPVCFALVASRCGLLL